MADVFANISMVFICRELLDTALKYIKKALSIYHTWDSRRISYYEQMGVIRLRLGQFDITEEDQRVAASWSELFYGRNHPTTKRIKLRQAYAALKGKGLTDIWIGEFMSSLNAYMTDHDNNSIGWALGAEYLSDILLMQNLFPEALDNAEKAKRIRERVLGNDHTNTRMTCRLIANIYACQGDNDQAIIWLKQTMPTKEKLEGGYAIVQETISHLYNVKGEWVKSIDCLTKAITHWENIYGTDCERSLQAMEKLAEVYLSSGQPNSAINYYLYIREHSKDYKKTSYYSEKVGDAFLSKHDYISAYLYYKNLKISYNNDSFSKERIDEKISQVKKHVRRKGHLYRFIFWLNEMIS